MNDENQAQPLIPKTAASRPSTTAVQKKTDLEEKEARPETAHVRQNALEDAAFQFVETLVDRADGQGGWFPRLYPMWHGWAIREAFVAGAKWREDNQ